MGLPRCPQCRSDAVVPHPHNAGLNWCRGCGRAGPVVEFHQQADHVIPPSRGHKPEHPTPRQVYRPAVRAFKPTPSRRPDQPHWWDDL